MRLTAFDIGTDDPGLHRAGKGAVMSRLLALRRARRDRGTPRRVVCFGEDN